MRICLGNGEIARHVVVLVGPAADAVAPAIHALKDALRLSTWDTPQRYSCEQLSIVFIKQNVMDPYTRTLVGAAT